jgi:hypothetical protein
MKTMSNLTHKIEMVTQAFGKHERLNLDAAIKLGEILDQANDEAILMLACADIRFVTTLAQRRAVDRGLIMLSGCGANRKVSVKAVL